jgi:hypothetical protein
VIYDADVAPDPGAWTRADEGDRLTSVEAHHRTLATRHPPVPNARVHAAIHVVVETQLASGEPPQARAAVARLLAAGRSRHEAIHLVAGAVAESLQATLQGSRYDAAAYARALDALGRAPAPGGEE